MKKKSILLNIYEDLFRNILAFVINQGIIFSLMFFGLFPLCLSIIELSIKLSHFSFITFSNILSFMLLPTSILLYLLIGLIIMIFLLFEYYNLIHFYYYALIGKRPNPFLLLATSLVKMVETLFQFSLQWIPTLIFYTIIINLPAILFLFQKNKLLKYTLNKMPHHLLYLVGLFLLIILVYGFVKRYFVFDYYLSKKITMNEAYALSKKTNFKSKCLIFLYSLSLSLMLIVIFAIIYATSIVLIAFFIGLMSEKSISSAAFMTLLEKFDLFFLITFVYVSTISQVSLTIQLFNKLSFSLRPVISSLENPNLKLLSSRKMITIIVVFILFIDTVLFYNWIRNGSVLNAVSFDAIEITSHRGFSHEYPENTLVAIEAAIDTNVDYIEIDVRSTADGVLVLLHDSSLKRTTGLDRYIWEVNYSEIKDLDAGSWLSIDFSDSKIPTLEEAIAFAKGKVLINIDFKDVLNSPSSTKQLVELIQQYDLKFQCVVTSTSIDTLREIKALDSDIQTGLITYTLSKTMLTDTSIDLFSMYSTFVNQTQVNQIHDQNKRIFVWTVNSVKEIERMNRLGVDNIITDNPTFTREVIFKSGNSPFINSFLQIITE